MAVFRMTQPRWEHLLWISTNRRVNHAARPNVLADLHKAGLLTRDAFGIYQIAPLGEALIKEEQKDLNHAARKHFGAMLNSVYFDGLAQRWVANYNTPEGSAVAWVRWEGKGKLHVTSIR